MYSSELEQRAQSVSNMLSTARETRPWSKENSEWPLDLTQGWDRWAEREVKRWSKKRVQSLSITMLGQLKSKSTFFSFIHTFGKRKTHCPPTRGRLTASHKRKKLDFTAS